MFAEGGLPTGSLDGWAAAPKLDGSPGRSILCGSRRGGSRYGLAALRREVDDVRAAPVGT